MLQINIGDTVAAQKERDGKHRCKSSQSALIWMSRMIVPP
ncbi:hypothetical protein OHAE_3885 [Ochrobactrum soli]|uniref:Uncharacterized protein n=1 Tax=Ochrobactrum soli TaxID=2448455 RepID=A0A2P9HIY7_9HYPH|nr:hypothetical protein OHAE_3885 [[Ochrobactrum] soli]